jgi:type IV pilus assembly protein PilE
MQTDLTWHGFRRAQRPSDPRVHARMRGMTLMELLTVMVILAVITTVSVNSYRKYMIRANRTDATGSLLRMQVAEEKYFLQNNTYTNSVVTLGGTSPTPQGHYTLAIAAGDSGDIGTSYKVTATAVNGQTDDTDCPTLSIDDKGVRLPNAATCWK